MDAHPHRDDGSLGKRGDWAPPDPGLRARAEAWFKRLPLFGGATDPAAGLLLWLIAVVGGVAFALAGTVFLRHDKDAREHVIQLAGGVIILFGAYFTARQLMNAQTQKYAERLSSTLGQLGSESLCVRLSAIRLLQGMLLESTGLPGDKRGEYIEAAWRAAIKDALRALADAGDPRDDPDCRLAWAVWLEMTVKQDKHSGQLHAHFSDEWIFEAPMKRQPRDETRKRRLWRGPRGAHPPEG